VKFILSFIINLATLMFGIFPYLCLVVNIVMRYKASFEIDKLVCRYQRNSSFFASDSFLYMLCEVVYSGLMPYPFLIGKIIN
jgi:hypothetical protein